jgi:hypothetical protein
MRLNLAKGTSVVVVAIVMMGTCLAGDAVQSGLKVGEPVNAFNVDDITGPNKGTTLCYR